MRIDESRNISTVVIIASAIVFVVLFLLYASMLSNQYSTANYGTDAGDLLGAVLTDGVPHPSGYPTYLIISKLFQYFPLNSPHLKGSLVSAFFAALTSCLTVLLNAYISQKFDHTGNRIFIYVVIGILLGISPLFWSQAVIVEVYAMTFFFFVCMLFWTEITIYSKTDKRSDKILIFLSLLIGIGFGTHLLLGLMVPVLIFAAVASTMKSNQAGKVIRNFLIMGLAAGAVYLILPLRARNFPPINWGNSQTLKGFLWLISGRLYQGLAFGLPASEIFPRIRFLAGLVQNQFWFVGLFLSIVGIGRLIASRDQMKWVYLYILIIYSVFSIGYLTNDSVVYLIPVSIVVVIFIGFGISELADQFSKKRNQMEWIIPIVLLLPLAIRFPTLYSSVDPRRENSARVFAEDCLDSLPGNAILFTKEDSDTFPLWYYHFGLGRREDIHIIVTSLLDFDWYRETLIHCYPDLIIRQGDGNSEDVIRELNPDYAICHTQPESIDSDLYYCECNEKQTSYGK